MKRLLLTILFVALTPPVLAGLPAPPKVREGPFPLFRKDQVGLGRDHRIANNDWITLTIYTKYSSTSPPRTRRYMLEKESIRYDGDWFTVSTLSNNVNYFMKVLNDDGLLDSGYGSQTQTNIGIKVNCKKGIVQTPSFSIPSGRVIPPLNYYFHQSGWFLTQHETDSKELISLGGNSREVRQIKRASLYNHLCNNNLSH